MKTEILKNEILKNYQKTLNHLMKVYFDAKRTDHVYNAAGILLNYCFILVENGLSSDAKNNIIRACTSIISANEK